MTTKDLFNKIHCIDCLEGIKQLDDESIDCIITDPPYGDNSNYGRMDKGIVNNENPLLNLQVLFDSQRVLKKNATIYNFTNWKHYPFLTEFVLRYTTYNIRMLVVLNKSNIGMGYGFRNKHELILVLEKGKPKYNTDNFPNVLNFNVVQHNLSTHPHEKPRDIIRRILLHSTNENEVVLDCFCGSGAVPIACKETNRKFIGFEIDKKWVDYGNNRLRQDSIFNFGGDLNEDKNNGIGEDQTNNNIEGDLQGTEHSNK